MTVIAPISHPRDGLRRLRGHAAGRGRPAARPDAREAPRGGHPRPRPRRRHRPAQRAPRRDRAARARTRSSSRRTRSRSRAGCGGTSSTRCGTPSAAGPFEHIVADPAEEAAGEQNVLVVANETLLGEPLLERIRERAARSPASFLIVSPQSDPSQGSHPEAERRLRRALAELRSDRDRRPRPDRAPRPVHGRDAGRPRRARRRDHRLDLPAAALGLAPARPGRAARRATAASRSSTSWSTRALREASV